MSFWNRILGFDPKKEEDLGYFESECLNCGIGDIEKMSSQPWTGKYFCESCEHYTYVVFGDRMGGALCDHAATDKKESDKF